MLETSWKKVSRVIIGSVVIIVIFGGGFYFGFNRGQEFPKNIVVTGVSNLDSNEPVTADFGLFWQAWDKINQKALNNTTTTDQEKIYGAISGLIKSIGDDHAEFFSPSDSEKFEEDIRGNFGGIGAEIGIRDKILTVIAPLKNTPASRAGLEPGDKIFWVDSTSTDDLNVDEAVKIIRGEVGTQVTLTIFREGWEKTKDITITRANIQVPTLDYEIREDGIAYISLYSFNQNSNQLFYEAILDALSKNAKGLILDLRNNPGGFLEVSVRLAGWFVPNGKVVVSEKSRSDSLEFTSPGNGSLEKFPTVIIINGGSASASEILAGALRDINGTKLVGKTTFGKGTVQQIENLADGSTLKLTTANWVLPSGKIIDKEGLEPDYRVELTEEDIENEVDPQLDKAVEVINEIIKNQ